MSRKTLAGPALIILAVTLLAIGGPSYVAWTSTKGLPSQTEGQTTRAGEGGQTQAEKAGGSDNGESYGRVQSGPVKSLAGAAERTSGKDGGLTGSRIFTRALQEGLARGKRSKPIVNDLEGQLNGASSQPAEVRTASTDSHRSVSRGADTDRRSLGSFLITAYTAGKESTGKSPGDEAYGVTATGTTAVEGRTISADWNVLPPGTKVAIEGLPGYYVVEDRSEKREKGGKIIGKHIDLFIPDLQAALEWGRQYRNVTVLEWGQ